MSARWHDSDDADEGALWANDSEAWRGDVHATQQNDDDMVFVKLDPSSSVEAADLLAALEVVERAALSDNPHTIFLSAFDFETICARVRRVADFSVIAELLLQGVHVKRSSVLAQGIGSAHDAGGTFLYAFRISWGDVA